MSRPLRIAATLHLKRLLVTGFGHLVEITESFRNERVDAMHTPESTVVKACNPRVDYTDMRRLAERLRPEGRS